MASSGSGRTPPTVMKNLIPHKEIDIRYDPSIAHRRRRIEWPIIETDLEALFQLPKNHEEAVSEDTKQLLLTELSKCATEEGNPEDLRIYDQVWRKDSGHEWRSVLANLYWRARRQSCVWDVFALLCGEGLVDVACLSAPLRICYGEFSESTCLVQDLLECFEHVHHATLIAHNDGIPLQATEWNRDIWWLATMIVRGGFNLRDIWSRIDQSEFLGPVNERLFQEFINRFDQQLPAIVHELNDSRAELVDGKVPPRYQSFGFFLPHGLGAGTAEELWNRAFAMVRKHFNAFEKAFRSEYSLSKQVLLLESEQAE